MPKIEKINEDKKRFLDLLLLADEQENMIDRYLPDGDLFALYDDDLKSVCVVLPLNSETCELKNIATYEKYQGKGYGRALINFICEYYKNDYKTMLVGTGETPAILSFYENCGFEISHRIKNFFTDNYDHPMFDGNIQLVDMIYLKKDLRKMNEMRKIEVNRIIEQLEQLHNNKNWAGMNLYEILNGITDETANLKLPNFNHTIHQIARHLVTDFVVIKRLQGIDYKLKDEEIWMPEINFKWIDTVNAIKENKNELIRELQNLSDENLDKPRL